MKASSEPWKKTERVVLSSLIMSSLDDTAGKKGLHMKPIRPIEQGDNQSDVVGQQGDQGQEAENIAQPFQLIPDPSFPSLNQLRPGEERVTPIQELAALSKITSTGPVQDEDPPPVSPQRLEK